MRRLMTSGAVLLLALAAGTASAQSEGERDGRTLYVEFGCYQCHGYEGQGGLLSGPRIAPDPLPLEAFIEVLRRPYGVMPAYSEHIVSDEILLVIHRYLQSIEPPEVESVGRD